MLGADRNTWVMGVAAGRSWSSSRLSVQKAEKPAAQSRLGRSGWSYFGMARTPRRNSIRLQ